MTPKISIISISSISALGHTAQGIWQQYQNRNSLISLESIGTNSVPVTILPQESKNIIETLRLSDPKYQSLDLSVLYAISTARQAVKSANWNSVDVFGINIGSSRGATSLFEKYHQEFLQTGKVGTLASPTTTLGNISSWVAHDLKSKGPEISHSITCSTGLHSLLNGIAWLRSGMANKFLIGASEAPLTPFTIAQMQALKIYSKTTNCLALDLQKTKNTMVLGEAAACLCLELESTKKALAYIYGIGYATDILEHNISISAEANCFQESMKMALGNIEQDEIDVIVMHAPGTIKGDLSEYKAIQKVFANHKLPKLTTNKWKIGHTFGTSGMLSIELAILMLQKQQFIESPYYLEQQPIAIKKILINSVGFGGNAVSVVIGI